MLTLLSPAKKLDFESPLPAVASTTPELLDRARVVLGAARELSVKRLAELMDLSQDLAELTHERFQALDLDRDDGRPALLAFAGDVYQGLQAKTLSTSDLLWAQDHVAILSGLYGLLRPLDRIQPYRLEMGSKLKNPRGRDLRAAWRDALAPAIDRLAGEGTVVNLASDEYFSAVDGGALEAAVVTPVFQDVKDGKARALFLFVKRARGAMTRWIVTHRVDRPEGLKDAEIDGYRFVAEASDEARWVFRRPQPPPMTPARSAARVG
jgi:uncharacterized protein